MDKNQKNQQDNKILSKLKLSLQSYNNEKNKDNLLIQKKCKCPELLRKKHKLNFDEDLPYHIKKKFTKNILLSEKNDKIILISKNEYIKNTKPPKEDKSTSNLIQINSKNKLKEITKSHSQNNLSIEELNEDSNVKDILNEISEITADLELFEMERRKRKIMKLIELMADKLDNNLTNPNELLNLFMLDKKHI